MSLLEARHLYRFFRTETDEVVALRDVSMTADAGELVAITGPSGSGKSTLMRCLAGLDDPDGGSVHLAGAPLSHRPEREKARLRAAHLAVAFQHRNLLDHLTVRGNVRLTQRLAGRHFAWETDEVLDRFGILPRASFAPRALSGGEAARAGLAAAVARRPEVLVADEPTAEIDTRNEERVLGSLGVLRDSGAAVVVVTHSERVAAFADRVLVLRDGGLES